MRISLQCGQATVTIFFHNDEEKSRDKEDHINHEMTKYNKHFKNKDYRKENNKETILNYVRKEYAPYIKLRKRKNKYTEEDLIFSAKGGFRENIIQIGNCQDGGKKMSKELNTLYGRYFQWHQATFPQITTLCADFHMDEATPHIHEVQSFWYMENGMRKPGVDKCLEQMGIALPDPNKPKSRINCRESTYTAMCRDKLIEIAKGMGLEIEDEPRKGQKHLNKVDAAARQMLELMGRAEDKIDTFLLNYEDYDGNKHKRAIKMDMSDDVIPEFDFNPYVLESKLEYFGSIVENAVSEANKAKLAQKKAETAVEEAQAAAEKLVQDATAKSGDIIRVAYKEAQNVLNKSDFMKGYETAKADTQKAIAEGKLVDGAKYAEVVSQLQAMTQLYNADHLKLAELEEALEEEKVFE